MKFFIKIVFVLAVIFSLAHSELSIDSQIQAIKNAPSSQRVQMMNTLKVRLSNMNAQDRSYAISNLRTGMPPQQQRQQRLQIHGKQQKGKK